MKKYYVYMLRCSNGSLYVGHTCNLEKRLREHNYGMCPGYTSSRLPLTLVWKHTFQTYEEAFDVEHQLKG